MYPHISMQSVGWLFLWEWIVCGGCLYYKCVYIILSTTMRLKFHILSFICHDCVRIGGFVEGCKNDKAYVYFTNSTLCSCTVGMWMLSVSLQVASHSNNDTKIYIRERKNRNRKFVIHWTIEGITALCLRLAYCAKRKKNTHFFLWLFESVWLSIGLYDNDNGARWFCYFHYVYSSIHVTCSPPLSIYRYICICIYNSFVFSSSAMFCFVIFFFVFLSPC